MKTTKAFPLGVVMSVVTGRLTCDLADIYEILNHMTDANLHTHQLPRAMEACKPTLYEMMPNDIDFQVGRLISMLEITKPKDKENLIFGWLVNLQSEHGYPESYDVPPLPKGMYTPMNPIDEALNMQTKGASS